VHLLVSVSLLQVPRIAQAEPRALIATLRRIQGHRSGGTDDAAIIAMMTR
jgi:hypothetical protein